MKGSLSLHLYPQLHAHIRQFTCRLPNSEMEMLTDSIIVIETATSKSHDLASAAVDNIIQRLEKVKRQLVQNESPDQLLPLSQFHKTANQKVLGAQKEWSTAVSKFGKEVEKVGISRD